MAELLNPPRVALQTPFGGPKKSNPATPPTTARVSRPGAVQPVTAQERAMYVQMATQAAQRHGMPVDIFLRQIQWESGFNPRMRGNDGEVGLTQIIPQFHPTANVNDPAQALDYSAKTMKKYHDTYVAAGHTDTDAWGYALAAWNAGTNAVSQNRIPDSTHNYVSGILGGTFNPKTAHQQSMYKGVPTNKPLPTYQPSSGGSSGTAGGSATPPTAPGNAPVQPPKQELRITRLLDSGAKGIPLAPLVGNFQRLPGGVEDEATMKSREKLIMDLLSTLRG